MLELNIARVLNIEVEPGDEPPHVRTTLHCGLPLPFAAPGTNEPLMAELLILRFKLPGINAVQVGKSLMEFGEACPEPSQLVTAASLEDATNTALALDKMTGKS